MSLTHDTRSHPNVASGTSETHLSAVAMTHDPEGLASIKNPNCAATIWQREPLQSFQTWINGLAPEHLPKARIMLQPRAVRRALFETFEAAGLPGCRERDMLSDDIAALADMFTDLMDAPYLRLRLDVVTTNACRKFHLDAVTARLVCTYRGTGTQYGVSEDGADPQDIFTTGTGSPILLRGSLWPVTPQSGLVHRSPPIEGTGETRLVLVLDPVKELPSEEPSVVLH